MVVANFNMVWRAVEPCDPARNKSHDAAWDTTAPGATAVATEYP